MARMALTLLRAEVKEPFFLDRPDQQERQGFPAPEPPSGSLKKYCGSASRSFCSGGRASRLPQGVLYLLGSTSTSLGVAR